MIVCVGLAEHIHTQKDTLRSGILLKTKRIFFYCCPLNLKSAQFIIPKSYF